MCFVFSGFRKFASKVKSSKMAWWSCYFKNGYFGIKFSMACINLFFLWKSRKCSDITLQFHVGSQNFTVFIKNRENQSTRNLIKRDDILVSFIFIAFYNTTHFKISSHFLWFWYIRDKVPFCLLLAVSFTEFWKIGNFPSAETTFKSPLPLVQYKVFWLCPYGVLRLDNESILIVTLHRISNQTNYL